MSEFSELRLLGADFNEFCQSITRAIQSLPPAQRKQFDTICDNCFSAFGFDGTRDRLNNKTVGQILEEFGNFPFPIRTIAEGEVDGVKYRLTEPISDPKGKASSG